MCASSACPSFGCSSGVRYAFIHHTIQKNPVSPVKTKAHCQPQASVIQGTASGVNSAPTFVPELNIPVASARSFFGNHSATVLIDAGKLPASPSPSRKRTIMKPTTEANEVVVETTPNQFRSAAPTTPIGTAHAWAIAAKLQSVIEYANPFFVPNLSINRPTNKSPRAYAVWNEKTIHP